MPQITDNLRMVDPVLTTIAQGYTNSAFIADSLFPTIKVSKLKGKFPAFGKDAFINRTLDRALRAQSNRISPMDISYVNFETIERDIETSFDYLEEEESAAFFKYEQILAKNLMDIMLVTKEKEAADLVQNVNNFSSSQKLVIPSDSYFDVYTNSADPVAIIRTSMAKVRTKIGRYPNTMVMGDKTYQALINHPKLLEKIKYSGIAKAGLPILCELFDIPEIKVGLSVYSNDAETINDIWGDNIIIAYVDNNEPNKRSEFNPSFGYTFQREGKPEIDSYYENGGKLKVVRCTDNYSIQITAPDAAFLISNTNQN
jgi:hypothetical protein